MFLKLFSALIFIMSFHVSAQTSNFLEGSWVSEEGNSIAEFTDSTVVFSSLSDKKEQVVFYYEPVDTTRYKLKGIGNRITVSVVA